MKIFYDQTIGDFQYLMQPKITSNTKRNRTRATIAFALGIYCLKIPQKIFKNVMKNA